MMADIFFVLNWIDNYVDIFQGFVTSRVVLAPLLLLFIEEVGVPLPVPGDMLIAYTGYRLSSQPGSPGLWQAFVTAQIASLLGATILFFLSRRWGQIIIMKIGRFIFLKEEHIRRAETLFARYGVLAIIFGRHIPGLRIPVTIFAATSGVKYPVFLVSTFISTAAWILIYLLAGRQLGAHFHTQIQRYISTYIAVLVGVTLLFAAIHLVGIYRESREKSHKHAHSEK